MKRRELLKSASAAAILVPASGCQSLVGLLRAVLQDPQIALRGMTVQQATLDRLDTIFDVEVKNPNPIGLRLDGLGYALALEGQRVARGNLDERIELPAEGAARLALPVSFPLGETAGAILRLIGKQEVGYRLDTAFKFRWQRGSLDVPVAFEGRMPMPQVPKVEVRELRFTSVGLQGLGVRVLTTVTNPNSYELPIDRFRFAVQINGNRVLHNQDISNLRLRPRQTRDLRLEFTVGLLELGLTALSLAQRPVLTWAVDAELKAGAFEMPFAARGDVPLA